MPINDAQILAFDRALVLEEKPQDRIAMDLASSRITDPLSGHMHVAQTNISKACVNPYNGSEIPDWEKLGLDPNRVYRLLRDPSELEKAASSFNGKPLVMSHRVQSADDKDHDNRVGSVSNVTYDHPYLKADLAVWSDDAIKAIESESQKQLSCGYGYKADMTPGTFDGDRFDGVMRGLGGNHVALVKEGRAGPDVMVGDSMENLFMNTKKAVLSRTGAFAQGALAVFLKPMLAMDAKIDFTPTFKDVTAKNFKDKLPGIVADIKRQTSGKLAKDASIDTISEVLEALAPILPADEPEPVMSDDPDDDTVMDVDGDEAAMIEKLKAMGYSVTKADAPAADEDKDDDDEKKKLADEVKAKDAEMKDMVKKPAMDAAIAQACKAATADAIKTQTAIRDAERFVRPWVGDLAMSFDSAEGVLRTALKTLGVANADKKHADSLRDILEAQPVPGSKPSRPSVALDAAGAKGFNERFPSAARIGHA